MEYSPQSVVKLVILPLKYLSVISEKKCLKLSDSFLYGTGTDGLLLNKWYVAMCNNQEPGTYDSGERFYRVKG